LRLLASARSAASSINKQVGMDRCGERDGRAFSEGTWFLLMAHGV
jgi:hypothetical protein